MSGRPTIVYRAANLGQAHVLKVMLGECGIEAWVEGQSAQESAHDWSSLPQVMVGEDDAEDARVVAQAFDERTRRDSAFSTDSPFELADEFWTAWPVCPQCGERRSARCPICGVSGTEFPLADMQDEADGQRVLFFCDACDDHFLPDWYRLCHRCGHDFGSGWEAAPPAATFEWNLRALLVAAAILAGLLALGGYFYLLFSSRAG